MNKFNLSILVAAITLTACNPNDAFTQKLETELDSVSYSLGAFNALQLQGQGLEDINANALSMGIKHIFNGRLSFTIKTNEKNGRYRRNIIVFTRCIKN